MSNFFSQMIGYDAKHIDNNFKSTSKEVDDTDYSEVDFSQGYSSEDECIFSVADFDTNISDDVYKFDENDDDSRYA